MPHKEGQKSLPLSQLFLVYLIDIICRAGDIENVQKTSLLNSILQKLVDLDVIDSSLISNGSFNTLLSMGSVVGNKVTSAIYDVVSPARDAFRNNDGDDANKFINTAISRFTPMVKRSASSAHLVPSFGEYLSSAGTFRASRYKQEFTELNVIGKGGFGCVVRARNNVDGREYAIKKVPIVSFDELSDGKIMREVRCLARLDHPNIVRYYSAWFEISDKPATNALDDEEQESESDTGVFELEGIDPMDVSCSDDSSWKQEFDVDRNTCWQGVDQYQLITDQDAESSSSRIKNDLTECVVFEGEAQNVKLPSIVTHPRDDVPKFFVILYIQMEYCAQGSLQDYLEKRFNGERVNVEECTEIFRQLCMGLKHIHDNGIAHRDLKPKNIFLSYSGNRVRVSIGDFGLATHILPETTSPVSSDRSNMISNISNTPTPASSFSEARSLSEGNLPETLLAMSAPIEFLRRERANSTVGHDKMPSSFGHDYKSRPPPLQSVVDNDLTQGVGTVIYSSPEQLSGGDYDYSTDLYSLGVILYELFRPFSTLMERAVMLKKLRKNGRCESEFRHKYPLVAECVRTLMNREPSDRPCCATLLNHPMFNNDDIVSTLKSEVQAKDEIIRNLQKEIDVLKHGVK